MPADSLPAEVRELLDARAAARMARDWAEADRLRDRIAELGWEVQDAPGGSTARPMLPASPASTGYARPSELGSLLDEPASVVASIQVVADEHADDFHRLLHGLAAHPPGVAWELIVVANAPDFEVETAGAGVAVEPVILASTERLGWADARSLGMRRSRGEVTFLLDASLEPTGDFVGPLLDAFGNPRVGLAGPWGVTSEDGRTFVDAPPGEVDAIEGYCLAVRRDALRAVPAFDRRFRFYRNADLDYSFAVRDAGWLAVRTDAVPLVRHEHRGWASLPDDERDRLSKRNFYRFLDRWGDREDLLTGAGDPG